MFGLGLWEWLGIVFLAMLLFGPKFLVSTFKALWGSLMGMLSSFQEAAGNKEEALTSPTPKSLNPAREHEEAKL